MKTQILPLLIMTASCICAQQWNPLGPGLNNNVYTIVTDGQNVYAGGKFTDAGGNADADYLARWDGNNWHAVAPGLTGNVYAIAIKDSLIYVGGDFVDAGGNQQADHIAYWDGNQWNALGNGKDGIVYTIAIQGTDVYAGGAFTYKISRWTGITWVGFTPLNGDVYKIIVDGIGIYTGGSFTNAGGDSDADLIAHWDLDEGWKHLAKGLIPNSYGGVRDMIFNNGYLYIIGDYNDCPFGNGTSTIPYLLRWDGSQSYQHVYGLNECRFGSSICIAGDYMYVGVIDDISGDAGVHRLNLITHDWEYFAGGWIIPQENNYGEVTLASDGNNVYVGHSFTEINNVQANNIAVFGVGNTSVNSDLNKKYQDLDVFPNPVEGTVHYQLGEDEMGPHSISLFNRMGEKILFENSNRQQLDMTFLPAGIYFLTVESKDISGVAKLIKL